MNKTLYYRTVISRKNHLLSGIFDFFLKIASFPRLLLEVFIRKNFGERYFSTASVITIALLLIIYPIFSSKTASLFSSYPRYGQQNNSILGENILWYLFVAAFLIFSFLRWKEVKKNPSVFDFKKFSLYDGDIHPFFYQIRPNGKVPTSRMIEILYEPFLFFFAGVVLWWFGQSLGVLLTVSAICYSISYAAAYHRGDHFIMDQIDQMILNEQKYNMFLEEVPASEKKWTKHRGAIPNDKEKTREMADNMFDPDIALAF